MTNEQKQQLLLKDICERLPYGVKVKYLYWDENKGCEYPIAMVLDAINSDGYIRFHGDIAEGEGRGMITQYLPYLRPTSSMTKEEKYTYRHMLGATLNSEGESIMFVYVEDFPTVIDWLNERHFDFRGLIEKGLAFEAPEGMYK